jgi:hypothetical protein
MLLFSGQGTSKKEVASKKKTKKKKRKRQNISLPEIP